MIYAKIKTDNTVLEYPLTSDQVRSRNLEISLPFILDEDSLPSNYVVVKTSDYKDIESLHINKIENMIPVKEKDKTFYTIDISDSELNNRHKEDNRPTALGLKKIEKYQSLVNFTDSFIDDIIVSYKIPKAERSTWDMQFKEALGWYLNPGHKTPVLDIIGTTRGVDKTILKKKALEKALKYQATISFVVGKKQAWEDLIDKSLTEDEVDSIVFYISRDELEAAENYFINKDYA